MKTLNQIAKENKVSKQQVYRIYKSEIEALHEAHQINGVIHLNEADENIIKTRLYEKLNIKPHQQNHIKETTDVPLEALQDEVLQNTDINNFIKNDISKPHQQNINCNQNKSEKQEFEADENIDINSFLEKNKFEAHQKYIIEILNEQLKVKDRQIADLNERLAESQELQRAHQVLLHQNQLQLQEKEKIIEELEEKNKAEEQTEKESETIELDPVKKSLWSKIFYRN